MADRRGKRGRGEERCERAETGRDSGGREGTRLERWVGRGVGGGGAVTQKRRRAKVDAGAVHSGEDTTSAVTCRPPPTIATSTPQPSVNETARQTHAEGLHQGKDGINIYLVTKYIHI